MTKKQRAFSKALALGLNATECARVAGYSDNSPGALRQTASRTLALPEIQRAAHAEREKIICGGLAQAALGCLASIIGNEDAPAAARVAAAKWALEAGGHGLEARKLAARLGDDSERAVSQMTAADLERLVLLAEDKVRFERGAMVEAEIIDRADSADDDSEPPN